MKNKKLPKALEKLIAKINASAKLAKEAETLEEKEIAAALHQAARELLFKKIIPEKTKKELKNLK